MNWAWDQTLEPTAKIVLLALADISDDRGKSWPSIPTIARKVCASERTVQRVVHRLGSKKDGRPALLKIVPRSRTNGSRSSNIYLLQMPGDNLSPDENDLDQPDADDRGVVAQLRQEGGDSVVTGGGDTAESPPEPPTEPPPEPKKRNTSNRAVDKQLSADTQRLLIRELSRLEVGLQSELMAQLAEGMRAGSIRSPAAWTKAAVDRMTRGKSSC